MKNIVSNIICTTFDNEVKNWQNNNNKKIAMFVSFSLTLDYDKEDGYRNLDLLIYGPLGYTGVLVKETWEVIPLNEIAEDGENLKSGYSYRCGDSGWMLISYHSSCWKTDGVEKVLTLNEDRITSLRSYVDSWYSKLEMTPDLLNEFNTLTHNRNNRYEVGKNVLKF